MTARPPHRFPRVGRLRKGYHRKQVDAFVDRVQVSLQGAFPAFSASDIRRVGFELVHGGYDVAAVDAVMDRLEEQAMAAQMAATSGRRGRIDPESEKEFLREGLDAPYMQRFPRVPALRRGYDVDDVDDFIDRVSEGLGGGPPLTLDEVRAVAFAPKRGGYAEDAVDETLDRVIELLLLLRTSEGPPSFVPQPPAGPDADPRWTR